MLKFAFSDEVTVINGFHKDLSGIILDYNSEKNTYRVSLGGEIHGKHPEVEVLEGFLVGKFKYFVGDRVLAILPKELRPIRLAYNIQTPIELEGTVEAVTNTLDGVKYIVKFDEFQNSMHVDEIDISRCNSFQFAYFHLTHMELIKKKSANMVS